MALRGTYILKGWSLLCISCTRNTALFDHVRYDEEHSQFSVLGALSVLRVVCSAERRHREFPNFHIYACLPGLLFKSVAAAGTRLSLQRSVT